ncbi:MAG: LuxR C-terminal-related transcriptional regulator [Myxococcales bacterium]
MFQRGWFLVEAREALLAETIAEVLQRYGVGRALRADLEGAVAPLLRERGRVAGIVVELGEDAVERVQALACLAPGLPLLALSRSADWQLVNAVQRLGAEHAMLPLQLPNVVSFAQRALCASFLPHAGVARTVSSLARARKLTAREVQILSYCLGNEPRARVRRRLGIAENTLKTQVRSLLRKCDARSVDALAKNVLRAALLEGRAQREPVFPWGPLAVEPLRGLPGEPTRDDDGLAESA